MSSEPRRWSTLLMGRNCVTAGSLWATGRARRPNAGSWRALLASALVLAGMTGWTAEPKPAASAAKTGIPTVGMEGRLEVTLTGTPLEARPVDEKSFVVLRIADTRPHGTLTWYDLRYIGLEPGKFNLRDYLRRADDSPTADLPEMRVEIAGLLPITHAGELIEPPRGVLGFFGGYRPALATAAGLWVLAALVLWLTGRRRMVKAVTVVAAPAPTLAERMRPLVEQAAAGQLTADGKAQLERLLLSHWRAQLNLGDVSQAEAIVALRHHPDAGTLLTALENWLHRPPGATQVDVNALLAPYRNASAEQRGDSQAPSP